MKTRARVHRAIHRELALLGVTGVEVRVSSTSNGLTCPGHLYVRVRPTNGAFFHGFTGTLLRDTYGWVPRTKRTKSPRGYRSTSAKAMALHVQRFGVSYWPGARLRAASTMIEGDVVAPISSDHVLHCGSSLYADAIVMSLDPFALCSRSGDMIWRSTVEQENFRVTGKPEPSEFEAAHARWARG